MLGHSWCTNIHPHHELRRAVSLTLALPSCPCTCRLCGPGKRLRCSSSAPHHHIPIPKHLPNADTSTVTLSTFERVTSIVFREMKPVLMSTRLFETATSVAFFLIRPVLTEIAAAARSSSPTKSSRHKKRLCHSPGSRRLRTVARCCPKAYL
jgi:hypothetical protein